jgi:hypothetical protein
MLSKLIKALGQAQEQFKMIRKNGRWLGKSATPLQLLLKVVKCSAAIPLHEFCFEEAFNSITN